MASSTRPFCLLLLCLVLCQAVSADMHLIGNLRLDDTSKEMSTTEKIQLAFEQITAASDTLRKAVQQINYINAPQQGFKVAEGFAGIISSIVEYTIRIKGDDANEEPPALPDVDAQLVVQSLTTFVQVHQALLNVVIGKHGLLTMIPFFEPIRLALVTLEATVDTFAFALIAEIPTQAPAARTRFSTLDVTLQRAITTYEKPFSNVEFGDEALKATAFA